MAFALAQRHPDFKAQPPRVEAAAVAHEMGAVIVPAAKAEQGPAKAS
jgi:hypothetical protein